MLLLSLLSCVSENKTRNSAIAYNRATHMRECNWVADFLKIHSRSCVTTPNSVLLI